MKNLKKIGTVLNKTEQKKISGGFNLDRCVGKPVFGECAPNPNPYAVPDPCIICIN